MSRSIVEASVEIAEAVVHADVGVVVGLIQGAGDPPYLAEIICERANYDNPAHRNAIGAALACLQHQAAENGEDTYPIPIYGDHGFEGWSRRKLEIVQAQPEGSTGK